jgi:phytoene dehydrogenase-like protein
MERGDFDVIVVGAGVGGLSAAGLLAASGLEVLVIDHTSMPGGALGAFRRDGLTHDLGASMLFGFGEPVTMVRHRALYRLNYGGDPIVFWPEIDRYLAGLARVLPAERGELDAFYRSIVELLENVIRADPVYVAPSEMRPRRHRHPRRASPARDGERRGRPAQAHRDRRPAAALPLVPRAAPPAHPVGRRDGADRREPRVGGRS